MNETETQDTPELVDAQGRSLRPKRTRNCPRCGAGPERRVISAGFGQPHDVCGKCGYDFEELTK